MNIYSFDPLKNIALIVIIVMKQLYITEVRIFIISQYLINVKWKIYLEEKIN